MSNTDICLECGRDFVLDLFHFDCTGEFVCSREEFIELIETDKFVRTQIPCTLSHERQIVGIPCQKCGAIT